MGDVFEAMIRAQKERKAQSADSVGDDGPAQLEAFATIAEGTGWRGEAELLLAGSSNR